MRSSAAAPVNSPAVFIFWIFWPTRCTEVRSRTISGPAIARSVPSSSRVTQGTIAPSPKRSTSSVSMTTWPRLTHHKPDDVWGLRAKGHKVDQQYSAFAGFEARLQDQAVATVTTRDTGLRVARRDPPAPMLLPAQECSKAGIRIEA